MKIIDLLNKIANGEEIPKKVKYDSEIYTYIKEYREGIKYINKELEDLDFCNNNKYLIHRIETLNDEVEILEEEKKIPEKLKIELNDNDENKVNWYRANNLDCEIAFKINEIIDYLKSKGE